MSVEKKAESALLVKLSTPAMVGEGRVCQEDSRLNIYPVLLGNWHFQKRGSEESHYNNAPAMVGVSVCREAPGNISLQAAAVTLYHEGISTKESREVEMSNEHPSASVRHF